MTAKKKKPQSINNILEHIAPKVRKALKQWEATRQAVHNGLNSGSIRISGNNVFKTSGGQKTKLQFTANQLGLTVSRRRFHGVRTITALQIPLRIREVAPKLIKSLCSGRTVSFEPGSPVFVFRGKATPKLDLKHEIDYTFFDSFTPINRSEYLVGYDVETEDIFDGNGKFKERKLLSHQWYFSFKGRRFGVILVTSRPISETALITFIRNVLRGLLPDDRHLLKNVYIAAHFSLIEYGFMKPSLQEKERLIRSGKTVKYKAKTIQSRRKQWTGKVTLMQGIPGSTIKGRRVPATHHRVWLHFVDSLNLQPGSLDNLGRTIGIAKIHHARIKEMRKFLEEDADGFYRYGIRDSIVTAEAFAYYDKKFGDTLDVGFQKRISHYSEKYFRNFFKEKFSTDKRKTNWKESFGWTRDLSGRWVVSPSMLSFIPFYYGGRNEVFCVGPRDQATYHDLKSAYPTSMLMIPDHDFRKMTLTRGSAVKTRIKKLRSEGPFQVVGVICHFRFKESANPIFPVRVPEGLIFPRTGHGPVMWPEFWTALELGLLEHYYVDTVIEFDRKNTSLIADETFQLLDKRRGEMKPVYKDLLNFFYGKTAQGVRVAVEKIKKNRDVTKIPTSTITCYPLASYMTSVCRAVVGELLNMGNPCFGITTDGFISPNPSLTPGPLCKEIQNRLDPLNKPGQPREFDFIQTEFSADRSLFVKTRGYILIDDSQQAVNKGKFVKMAQMGIQTDRGNEKEQIAQMLTALIKKEYTKLSWPSIPQMTFDEVPDSISVDDEITKREIDAIRAYIKAKNFAPVQVASIASVNANYDMKRRPLKPQPASYAFQDLTFYHVNFETESLYATEDFTSLRIMSKPNMNYIEHLDFTGNAPKFFAGSGPAPSGNQPVNLVLVGDGRLVVNEDNTERNFCGTINMRDVVTEINYDRRKVNEPTFHVYDVTDGGKSLSGVIFGWSRTKDASAKFSIIWHYGHPGQTALRVVSGKDLKERNYDEIGFEVDEGLEIVFVEDQHYVFGDKSFLTRKAKRKV